MSMIPNGSLALLLAAALVSGCVDGPELALTAQEDTSSDAPLPSTGTVSSASWMGYAKVGAAFDPWMHVNPPEEAGYAVWKEGFLLNVTGNITALELRMDWSASPEAEALVMIHSPHNDGGVGMTEYTTQMSSDRHPCLRIPRADLEAIQAAGHNQHGGHWYPMFHPQGGVDYVVNITVTVIGGTATIVDGPHGHNPTDSGEMLALVQAGLAPGATEPCRGPLGEFP